MVTGYIEDDLMLTRNLTLLFFFPRYLWALVDLVRNFIFANNNVENVLYSGYAIIAFHLFGIMKHEHKREK